MATALRRPVGHDERLSIVDHLDELRSRLIVSVVAIAIAFGVCLWQNSPLIEVVNDPLASETERNVEAGEGPLGQVAITQRALRAQVAANAELARTLAEPAAGLPSATRERLAEQARALERSVSALPLKVEGNKPVTLGVGEPFMTTLTISFMFALLFAMPFVLWQAYAFVLPAFSPQERRAATSMLAMVPVLFVAGVLFGYFAVLPAAVAFLQGFNSDEFNVLVQARDYLRFALMTLITLGLVFQTPVGILLLVRLGVVSVAQLRRNRRYAIVVCAIIAMLLPGTDPVTMLLCLAPLLVLYEGSILLASLFGGSPDRGVDADDPWALEDDFEDLDEAEPETSRDAAR